VVGFVSLYGDKVEQLFTAPSAQGAGVGRQILAFVKAQRPDGFRLTSLIENGGANRFYEREGMKRGETLRHEKYGQLVRYDWRN
jgi:GNAT superfamily N-acetyltransferase